MSWGSSTASPATMAYPAHSCAAVWWSKPSVGTWNCTRPPPQHTTTISVPNDEAVLMPTSIWSRGRRILVHAFGLMEFVLKQFLSALLYLIVVVKRVLCWPVWHAHILVMRMLVKFFPRYFLTHSNMDLVGPQPHEWGLRVSEMTEFHNEIKEDLEEYCIHHKHWYLQQGTLVHVCEADDCKFNGDHREVRCVSCKDVPSDVVLRPLSPNMHLVVPRWIRWQTRQRKTSYALHKHARGLPINKENKLTFVSHCWEEDFTDFVTTLEKALDPSDVVWVCSFALPQHEGISSMLDNSDLEKVPFARALKEAKKLLVAMDRSMVVPTRAWCVFEMHLAKELGIPVVPWLARVMDMGDENLKSEFLDVDMDKCTASKWEDESNIKKFIIQNGRYGSESFEALNTYLKCFLFDKIKFFQAAFKELGKANDLEKELFMKERLLQESQDKQLEVRTQLNNATAELKKLKLQVAQGTREDSYTVKSLMKDAVERQEQLVTAQRELSLEMENREKLERSLSNDNVSRARWKCLCIVLFLAFLIAISIIAWNEVEIARLKESSKAAQKSSEDWHALFASNEVEIARLKESSEAAQKSSEDWYALSLMQGALSIAWFVR